MTFRGGDKKTRKEHWLYVCTMLWVLRLAALHDMRDMLCRPASVASSGKRRPDRRSGFAFDAWCGCRCSSICSACNAVQARKRGEREKKKSKEEEWRTQLNKEERKKRYAFVCADTGRWQI